jgi:membrane protein DedA with SNARE-associated domain
MELLNKYGYSLVFCVVLLEQLGLPIPAAPILVLAGALAAQGELSFSLILIFGALAALIGDYVWHEIGKRQGRKVLKLLCHVSLNPDSCVKKTEQSFTKYGMNSLLFAKFVPGLNTIAPPMAGMFQAKFLSFLWRDVIGILVYLFAWLIAGYFIDKIGFDISAIIEEFGRTFIWMLIAGLAAYVAWKYIKLKLLQRLLFEARISPHEVYQRMTSGEEFVIVDLRTNAAVDDEYETIPGAIRIRPDEIDEQIHLLDKNRWIVMYCT